MDRTPTHRGRPCRFLFTLSVALLTGILASILLAGCGRNEADRFDAAGRFVIEVWAHSGQEAERRTLVDQVNRFNEAQEDYRVNLTVIPEGAYNAQVQAAALAGGLPDLLEFDGPFLYNYIWQGHLTPIDDYLDPAIVEDLLPSIIDQGTYEGRLYSVGVFDSGLGLYANRRHLNAVNARIPEGVEDAWTIDELDAILSSLQEQSPGRAVIDLKVNYTGEWYSYAFSPVLQSAGGDLISRNGYPRADGYLNSPESIAAFERIQDWFDRGYVDPNIDDDAFIAGRVGLSWSGHWDYRRYHDTLGDNLVLLPLPDFGEGSRTGMGSWNWGLTRYAPDPEAAVAFLEFLLQPEEVLAMVDANAAVPSRHTAIERSDLYAPGSPLNLFVQQLETSAVPRPKTPAYPVITSVFEEAFSDIRNMLPVDEALERATLVIDRDIDDNDGYRTP